MQEKASEMEENLAKKYLSYPIFKKIRMIESEQGQILIY